VSPMRCRRCVLGKIVVDENVTLLTYGQQPNCARSSDEPRALCFLEMGLCDMGRLRAAPSRLKAPPSRIGRSSSVSMTRDQKRSKEKPWRKWYSSKRWLDMRRARLKLCQWRCEQTGVLLIGRAHEPNSPVLDHKEPHRGDPDLFWDPDNVQIVAKSWHDKEKQKQEHAGLA
jgi:5-methylcytosine-specific restriction enzyme A